MAITSTQSSHQVRNVAVGSYLDTGTAAAFDINCGFKPRYVKVMNEDGDCYGEWFEGMANSEMMKMIGDTSPAVLAKMTTHGIIPLDNGFTVGLDTDLNVTSQQLSWLAMG